MKLIPEDKRDTVIKEALQQLHGYRGIENIDFLSEIVPIGDTVEDFINYISS